MSSPPPLRLSSPCLCSPPAIVRPYYTYYPSASPLLSAGRPVGRSGRPVSRVKHTRRVGRLCGSSRSPRPGFNRCGGTRWNTVAEISGVTNGKSLVIALGALRMRWRHNPTTPCRASANGGPNMWGPHYTYPCRPVPKRSPLENQESGADRAGTLAAAVDRRRSGTGEPQPREHRPGGAVGKSCFFMNPGGGLWGPRPLGLSAAFRRGINCAPRSVGKAAVTLGATPAAASRTLTLDGHVEARWDA